MNGILVVDKPQGITSHDVVDVVRKRLRIRRVGHAGTLDPMATGVLVILVGTATKLAVRYLNEEKEYDAVIELGISTDTGDRDGKILQQEEVPMFSLDQICAVLKHFVGSIWQTPPAYSAIHYQGRRLYEWAREGKRIQIPSRQVVIHQIELVAYHHSSLQIHLICSKGTYIRRLAEQIGESLGVPAHLAQLRRIRVGHLTLDRAVTIDNITQDKLVPV